MNTVMVRNLEIGAGAPKIIVPIVAKTREGILEKAAELKNYTMDLVEWRADFYEDALDVEKTVETAELLNKALGELPLLYTFRTALEGGNKEITPIHYTALNKAVAESGFVDIIDVESNTPRAEADENIRNIHAAHLPVIGSYHNFSESPDTSELLYIMRNIQRRDADIVKVAVMPRTRADVASLLDATQIMFTKYALRPILTMSMGQLGVISRVTGDAFGSCATFGAVGQTSAPGQIPVNDLHTVLRILHEAR